MIGYLKRTYDRNESKRPAFLEPKQTLDVTSYLLSGILCQQYTFFVYEKINQNKVISG